MSLSKESDYATSRRALSGRKACTPQAPVHDLRNPQIDNQVVRNPNTWRVSTSSGMYIVLIGCSLTPVFRISAERYDQVGLCCSPEMPMEEGSELCILMLATRPKRPPFQVAGRWPDPIQDRLLPSMSLTAGRLENQALHDRLFPPVCRIPTPLQSRPCQIWDPICDALLCVAEWDHLPR